MTDGNVVKCFIVYELDIRSHELHTDFRLKYCLFGVVKLTNNAGHDKYFYTGYGIGFDSGSHVSVFSFDLVKNI